MKEKVFFTVVLLVVLVSLLVGVGAAAADSEGVTPFVGTERIPDSCPGFTDFDGTCALDYTQPPTWTPDGQHLQLSRVSYWRDDANDPRMSGYNTVEANVFLNSTTSHGHIWGTWYLDPDGFSEGTGWEGTWNGQLFPDQVVMVATARGTGDFEGLFVRMRIENGSYEGMIIEQGG